MINYIYIHHFIKGLYPAYHGIVANSFYDPVFRDNFYIGAKNASQSRWWGGEPVSTLSFEVRKNKKCRSNMQRLVCYIQRHLWFPSRFGSRQGRII